MRTHAIGFVSLYSTTWWKVDLGGVYSIYSVTILFKNYVGLENRRRGRFAGFSLYVSNIDVFTTTDIMSSSLCYKDGPNLPPLNFTTSCTEYSRYVIFYNERLHEVTYHNNYELSNVYTELCEVFVQGCKQSNVYGSNCDLPCPSNCKDSICHIENGNCFVCKSGWTGTYCNAKCAVGWYGVNCSRPCYGHCRDSSACNHVTGQCELGCDAGWTGSLCDKECDYGNYGYGCMNNCSGHCLNESSCNKHTGKCDRGCNPGYTNSDCSKGCLVGYFGIGCRERCSKRCINHEPCDHVSGECSNGCQDGYIGSHCNNACIEGYYGINCSLACSPNCNSCRHTDGMCTCKTGWTGFNCTTAKNLQTTETRSSDVFPWMVAFSLTFVTCMVFISTTLILLWRFVLKRKLLCDGIESCWRSTSNEKKTNVTDEASHYQDLNVSKEENTYQTLEL